MNFYFSYIVFCSMLLHGCMNAMAGLSGAHDETNLAFDNYKMMPHQDPAVRVKHTENAYEVNPEYPIRRAYHHSLFALSTEQSNKNHIQNNETKPELSDGLTDPESIKLVEDKSLNAIKFNQRLMKYLKYEKGGEKLELTQSLRFYDCYRKQLKKFNPPAFHENPKTKKWELCDKHTATGPQTLRVTGDACFYFKDRLRDDPKESIRRVMEFIAEKGNKQTDILASKAKKIMLKEKR